MPTKTVRTITEADFDHEVLASPVPVLLDFGAAWCPPCRVIEPLLDRLASQHEGRVRVLKVDADASAALAARHRVRALPTVISFVAGAEHKRHVGSTSMDGLLGLLPNAMLRE